MKKTSLARVLQGLIFVTVFLILPSQLQAGSLSLSPTTGIYNLGSTFSVRVVVNTSGKVINAAEGTLTFNPTELTIISVDRTGSIFNLWVTEPTFSNSAGTVSFSGGAPTGYSGSSGTIFNITVRAKGATAAKLKFANGAILANDGQGTNIISGMNGGTYTINAISDTPTPEVVQYVPPPNTPAAPNIISDSHPDQNLWYAVNQARLSWELPNTVEAVRTLLDNSPYSIPTKIYEERLKELSISDLEDGVSYFHLQFRNADGWGKVSHFRIGVDTNKPENLKVSLAPDNDQSSPSQKLKIEVMDNTSKVFKYKIKVDEQEPFLYEDKEQSGIITLNPQAAGYHTAVIEAFDEAGNSQIETFSFTIEAFGAPSFTEYPTEISEEVIPVIKGLTKPTAKVEIELEKVGSEPVIYNSVADDQGVFLFIPSGRLSSGVYELTAKARLDSGAESAVSEAIKIAVQQPGYLRIGNFLINLLSVIVPLLALIFLLILTAWFGLLKLRGLRKSVRRESVEVEQVLHREFKLVRDSIEENIVGLTNSRRTKKLTDAEKQVFARISEALDLAEVKINKEVIDVEKLVNK